MVLIRDIRYFVIYSLVLHGGFFLVEVIIRLRICIISRPYNFGNIAPLNRQRKPEFWECQVK